MPDLGNPDRAARVQLELLVPVEVPAIMLLSWDFTTHQFALFGGGQCGETCAGPAHCLPKGTRFHDLRHFYASTLIAANLNPKADYVG